MYCIDVPDDKEWRMRSQRKASFLPSSSYLYVVFVGCLWRPEGASKRQLLSTYYNVPTIQYCSVDTTCAQMAGIHILPIDGYLQCMSHGFSSFQYVLP